MMKKQQGDINSLHRMEDTMEELLKIMEEIRPDVDFTKEMQLVDDGILDSFDIISMVDVINTKFEIEISVEDLLPDNFNSATALYSLVTRLAQK